MGDRPIIFSAPMIRALLDGRKTQTRRVLKPQPACFTQNVIDITKPMQDEESGEWGQIETIWSSQTLESRGEPLREEWRPLRIKHRAGDRLWVRENWSHSGAGVWSIFDARLSGPSGAIYAADWKDSFKPKWFPSIHMPREFSRLTLIVESVKVERLQDISEADARAEGAGLYVSGHGFITETELRADPGYSNFLCPRLGFEVIWSGIHGVDAWALNPWVAAIAFRVVKANIDAIDLANRQLVCEET